MKIRHVLTVFFLVMGLLINAMYGQKKSVLEKEKERMRLNEKYDKHDLREKTEFVIDHSEKFLKVPKTESPVGEFSIAQVSPTVKLQILPHLEPEYFTEIQNPEDVYMFSWANWAYVSRSEENLFYFAASNHLGHGCQINIYEYAPDRELLHRVVDVTKVLGWTKNSYTDGKIHGHMGIMPNGTLWACTHFGPHPDKEWFANGYRGSWMLSYNVYTRKTKNWGVPLVGGNLATFHVDTKRGYLVGTGSLSNMVLCYNILDNQVHFAGYPPKNWKWGPRTMLCDKKTGKFWTVDYNNEHAFFSFHPEYNSFEHFDVRPPANPYSNEVGVPRGHTDCRAMDGWYYWATWNGTLFKFEPEGSKAPLVELVGTTWDKGRDTLQLAMGPHGRYIYYYPKENSPIVQYDVKTGKRKILCWLQDYYFQKYGYFMGQVYGMNISKDGSFLVIVVNGSFQGKEHAFGHPGLLIVEIPEEERPLEE